LWQETFILLEFEVALRIDRFGNFSITEPAENRIRKPYVVLAIPRNKIELLLLPPDRDIGATGGLGAAPQCLRQRIQIHELLCSPVAPKLHGIYDVLGVEAADIEITARLYAMNARPLFNERKIEVGHIVTDDDVGLS
jgi:hypothetical protein